MGAGASVQEQVGETGPNDPNFRDHEKHVKLQSRKPSCATEDCKNLGEGILGEVKKVQHKLRMQLNFGGTDDGNDRRGNERGPSTEHAETGENDVSEPSSAVFQVRVPPGVPPLGHFSAICQGLLVSVQVPEGVSAGEIVEIDLGGSLELPQKQVEEDHKEDQEITGKAAQLFLKYDVDNSHCISVAELRSMLETEFKFEGESEILKAESQLAGVSEDHALTFDEFKTWYEHLQIRMQVYEHDRRKQDALEEELKRNEQEKLHHVERIKEENERLQAMVEAEKRKFQQELENLKRDKERLEKARKCVQHESQEFKKLSIFEQRNIEKQKIMERQKLESEELVERMKQDYIALTQKREKDEDLAKEEQRRKLQAKLKERKVASAKGHHCEQAN